MCECYIRESSLHISDSFLHSPYCTLLAYDVKNVSFLIRAKRAVFTHSLCSFKITGYGSVVKWDIFEGFSNTVTVYILSLSPLEQIPLKYHHHHCAVTAAAAAVEEASFELSLLQLVSTHMVRRILKRKTSHLPLTSPPLAIYLVLVHVSIDSLKLTDSLEQNHLLSVCTSATLFH